MSPADFAINSSDVLSEAVDKSQSKCIQESAIILSAALFGSIYLFSNSLNELNKKWTKDNQASVTIFEVVNGLIMSGSGIIIFLTARKAFEVLKQS